MKIARGTLKTLSDIRRQNRNGDNLRMRVRYSCSCLPPVVVKNRYIFNATLLLHSQKSILVGAHDKFRLAVIHLGKRTLMIAGNYHFVKSDAVASPVRAEATNHLAFSPTKGRILVWNYF